MHPELFGVFKKLADRLDNVVFESYYGPTMSDFTRDSAWGQVWDIPSLSEHVPAADNALVFDLGTGDGRIIKRLHDVGVAATFVGVDNAPSAALQFQLRQQDHGFPGTFVQANFLSGWEPEARADAAIFGSVSINGLHSIELLTELFRAGQRFLVDNGRLVLSVYVDEATKSFPELDGVLDVSPYTTMDGTSRLMWRGLKFQGPAFRHNAFVDRSAEQLPNVLCWERERVWSESELVAIGAVNGWSVHHRSVSSVADGGAEGFEVATLSFVRHG